MSVKVGIEVKSLPAVREENLDVYNRIASRVFDVAPNQVNDRQRKAVKVATTAWLYDYPFESLRNKEPKIEERGTVK